MDHSDGSSRAGLRWISQEMDRENPHDDCAKPVLWRPCHRQPKGHRLPDAFGRLGPFTSCFALVMGTTALLPLPQHLSEQ